MTSRDPGSTLRRLASGLLRRLDGAASGGAGAATAPPIAARYRRGGARTAGVVRQLPSSHARAHVDETLARYGAEWFYEFTFANGAGTAAPSDVVNAIHHTRAELIFPLLDDIFGGEWERLRCLDLACHQGWFTTQLAARNAGSVLGMDIRARHIEMATVVADMTGLGNVQFRERSIFDVTPQTDGTYDLTLLLGLLYHLDDPLRALKIARQVTRRLCVIETQVARATPTPLACTWGSAEEPPRQGPGIAVLDADPTHAEPGLSIALVPTLEALYRMLYAAGFDQAFLAVPTPGMFEQYPIWDRVVVFARVDAR